MVFRSMSRSRFAVVALVLVVSVSLGAASADELRLLVSNSDLHRVEVRFPDGSLETTIPTGIEPNGMLVREGKLWVANRGVSRAPGSSLTVIDLKTRRSERTVFACEACAPHDLVFDAEGTLWFIGQAHGAVYRMESPFRRPAGSTVISKGRPMTLLPFADGDTMVVGMRGTASVALIGDPAEAPTMLDVESNPERLLVRPGSEEIWTFSAAARVTGVIREGGEDGPEVELIRGSASFHSMAFTPDGTKMLVGASPGDSLRVFDAISRDEVGTLVLEGVPTRMALAPDGKRLALFMGDVDAMAIVSVEDPSRPEVIESFDYVGRVGEMIWVSLGE